MNKIFVTGDVHGDVVRRLSSKNFPIGKTLDLGDLVFLAGDVALIWNEEQDETEKYNIKSLSKKPFTIMCIGGNHDNWDRLIELPIVEKFGVKLGYIADNIFFVPNGTLIEYAGKKIFCFGGAMSTDKTFRLNYEFIHNRKIWWEREIPTVEEMDFGTRNLEKVDYKVDIIISHTMPIKSVEACIRKLRNEMHFKRVDDPTANYLSSIKRHTTFNKWYCGHFHTSNVFDGVNCIYYEIINVDDSENIDYGNKGVRVIDPLW